jgi:uncharacterized membrane protein
VAQVTRTELALVADGARRHSARMLRLGRGLFAIGVIGIGVTHFVFGRFTTGRAPAWPESWIGETAWAYASGAMVILFGVAVLLDRHLRVLAPVVAGLIATWALLRQVPVVVAAPLFGGAWTLAGKALTLTGGVLAMMPGPDAPSRGAALRVKFAQVAFGAFLLVAAVQHFLFTPFVASLFPSWFPGDLLLWSRAAGVALGALGIGLLLPRTAPTAALMAGAMIFSWFWIIHLPRMLASPSDTIAVFEALAFAGLGFVLAVPTRQQNDR